MSSEAQYPEHEKLSVISDTSQIVGEFLESCGYTLCKMMYRAPFNGIGALSETPNRNDSHGRYVPVSKSTNQILADYFGIDPNKLEKEKQHMLKALNST